jgi:hypothetical protein
MMKKNSVISMASSVLVFSLAIASSSSFAEEKGVCAQAKNPVKCEALSRKMIYGGHLMTKKERAEHREKMMSLKTIEERDAFRAQHHQLMLDRARERGVKLAE